MASSLHGAGGSSAALFAPVPTIAKAIGIINNGRSRIAFRLRLFMAWSFLNEELLEVPVMVSTQEV
jgi:hypothetical protein